MNDLNVLLITSDQHNPFIVGCAGDPVVRTPTLDHLAESGTVFDAAYTNSPICVPARASLATGRFASTIGCYDNGTPYRPDLVDTFGHRVHQTGGQAVTFGKLHFDPDGDAGFDSHLPLQAKKGSAGALAGWARAAAPPGRALLDHVLDAAPGISEYELYDRHTTESACRWLTGGASPDQPWVAHVSYAYPHYPFRAPVDLLPPDDLDIPLPPAWRSDDWPHDRELDHQRRIHGNDQRPLTEDEIRRVRWVYAAMVAFVDQQVAAVLDALEAGGHADRTLVIYTSDHGDMLGSHGLIMKCVMYDASARVPMLMSGPGVAADATCSAPVSLVDVFPTVVATTGAAAAEVDAELPGRSLVDVAAGADNDDEGRSAFSEFHGPHSTQARFLVRTGSWKYVKNMADPDAAQLFDLSTDPDELTNLARATAFADRVASLESDLRSFVDPEAVNRKVLDEQADLLAAAGGLEALDRAKPVDGARTPYGTVAGGWTVPPPDIMATVDPSGPFGSRAQRTGSR